MGQNFHTSWIDDTTTFQASEMNVPLLALDMALTYLKNVIVHADGVVTWRKDLGRLVWNDDIRIHFVRDDGDAVENTIAAGYIAIADNQFAYIDLSESHGAVRTVSVATITGEAAAGFLAYNRLVLGYRNTWSDEYFPVYLRLSDLGKVVQSLAGANTVTVDWSLGSTVEVELDRATTTFAFAGAHDGQRCVLVLRQDGAGGRSVAFGAEVRDCDDLPLPPTLSVNPERIDYMGFIYRDEGGYYDCVSLVKGFQRLVS